MSTVLFCRVTMSSYLPSELSEAEDLIFCKDNFVCMLISCTFCFICAKLSSILYACF